MYFRAMRPRHNNTLEINLIHVKLFIYLSLFLKVLQVSHFHPHLSPPPCSHFLPLPPKAFTLLLSVCMDYAYMHIYAYNFFG